MGILSNFEGLNDGDEGLEEDLEEVESARTPKVDDKVILFGWPDYRGAEVIEVSTNGRIRVLFHGDDGPLKHWKNRDEYELM